MYDYLKAIKEDVKEYVNNEINLSDYEDMEELEQELNDTLWIDDSVTGNGSGSYTFSRQEAKKNLIGNFDLIREMIQEFCIPSDEVIDKFLSEDYEYFDVSIRCYLLGQAIAEVLEEMNGAGATAAEIVTGITTGIATA